MEKYDLVTLYQAENDRRSHGMNDLKNIVEENKGIVDTMSTEDQAYYYACVFVIGQTADHNGKSF